MFGYSKFYPYTNLRWKHFKFLCARPYKGPAFRAVNRKGTVQIITIILHVEYVADISRACTQGNS